MDKLILKKIAKEWPAGILYYGTGTDSFNEEMIFPEESGYIVSEVQKIALRINNKEVPESCLDEIIKKYYDYV